MSQVVAAEVQKRPAMDLAVVMVEDMKGLKIFQAIEAEVQRVLAMGLVVVTAKGKI